jgi:hypothetical protein
MWDRFIEGNSDALQRNTFRNAFSISGLDRSALAISRISA